MAATLLSLATATLNGESVQKGRSPFADRLGEAVASPVLSIVDDPTDHHSWGATTYDGEGLACRRNPLIDAGILEGITRDAVIELARAGGIAVHERSMDRHDIYTADECFLTGTAAEVIPVVECDGRSIGTGRPGPIFQDLRRRFHSLVREER